MRDKDTPPAPPGWRAVRWDQIKTVAASAKADSVYLQLHPEIRKHARETMLAELAQDIMRHLDKHIKARTTGPDDEWLVEFSVSFDVIIPREP